MTEGLRRWRCTVAWSGVQIYSRRVAEDLDRQSSKEDTRRANRSMKRSSASLTIREKQVRATVRCHITPARMASIKKEQETQMMLRVWRKESTFAPLEKL